MGGKTEKITITADKGRLSEEDIQRMIQEAEEYAEEDRLFKDRVESRNALESYLYGLKNSLDGESSTGGLSMDDKKELLDLVDEKLDWMEDNPDASKEDLDEQRKEVEQIAIPVMREAYSAGERGDSDDEYFESDI